MDKTQAYFKDYCDKKGLKSSQRRDKVVQTFLVTEKHVSCFELYDELRKKEEKIGFSTVFRTLKLLEDAGIAQAITIDNETHFEHKYQHKHHDHFICEKCGKTIEFTNPTIERIQEKLAIKHDFTPQRHNLIIYGICSKCKR